MEEAGPDCDGLDVEAYDDPEADLAAAAVGLMVFRYLEASKTLEEAVEAAADVESVEDADGRP